MVFTRRWTIPTVFFDLLIEIDLQPIPVGFQKKWAGVDSVKLRWPDGLTCNPIKIQFNFYFLKNNITLIFFKLKKCYFYQHKLIRINPLNLWSKSWLVIRFHNFSVTCHGTMSCFDRSIPSIPKHKKFCDYFTFGTWF